MKELTFHQAADAVRAGKDILLATRFTKSLVNTAFFDAERYFIDEPDAELNKSNQELKKIGPAAVKLAYDKIMEMRDAGKTYEEIGAHFGCTGQTIRNFLAREGKAKSQKGE